MDTEKIFTINAKTCTLKYNRQEHNSIVLDNQTKYIIPIYQRSYSWTYEQLQKFISDIFSSFWGSNGKSCEEPMFIGTMQLSIKNSFDQQEIIDGQQRITTFLILIKVLKEKFPDCKELNNISLNFLETKVNSGKQQIYLDEFLSNDLSFNDETLNPYFHNAFLVNELLNEHLNDEKNNPINFNIEKFTRFILTNIYFVVIETQAGLSKTLQIFNSINTTGLDLNGGDLFKIKMYEYLKDKKGLGENVFEEISELYCMIDEQNDLLKYKATDLMGILWIYQHILIAKYNLPTTLYTFSTETFFERLFDTILGVNQWEHFRNNVSNVELSIEEIKKIIEARYKWENQWYISAEDLCSYKLIAHSRYGRYADLLPVIIIYRDTNYDKFYFLRLLSRVYFIYSVRFQKSIYEIHNWSYELIKEIVCNNSFKNIIAKIKTKIGDKDSQNTGDHDLDYFVSENLTENAKRKNLVCWLSAMLEEDFKTIDKDEIDQINKSLFETPFDIEHIQSYHDNDGERREDIWNEWKDDINSIGNLMILEQDINRSISNNVYDFKVNRYRESKFSIVRKHFGDYSEWNLENCLLRKQREIQKINNYLFSY